MLAGDFIQALAYLPKDLYFRIIYELDKYPELISYAQNNFKRKSEALRSKDPMALKRVVEEEVQELRKALGLAKTKSKSRTLKKKTKK